MMKANWTPASDPPLIYSDEWGSWRSRDVLGVVGGTIRVVSYEVDDEGCASWFTCCSERWDVTGRVTHWMPLPDLPDAEGAR